MTDEKKLVKVRTSITLSPGLYRSAKELVAESKFESFSALVESSLRQALGMTEEAPAEVAATDE